MSVDRPIFLLGTGRCGSTMLHHTMAVHRELTWLSRACAWVPRMYNLNHTILKMQGLPIIGPILQKGFPPDESYNFWERFCKGFSSPFRDLYASDAQPRQKEKLHEILSNMVSKSRPRLLIKLTGWPRVGFLNEIFPDAYFIHVVRDGRAVANSFLDIGFWDGWQGPHNWRTGPLPKDLQMVWEKCGQSFVALAAIHWIILMRAMDEAKKCVPPSRFMEIRYEDICESPKKHIQEILDFTGLPSCSHLEKALSHRNIKSQNEKWKKDLSFSQQEQLEEVLKPYLTKYGYLPALKEVPIGA